MNRRLTSLAALIVLLVLFFGINILAQAALRSARLDLTEHNLYTISDGARNIAAGIDEPVRLYFYYSASLAPGRPLLKTHGQRVRELLEEFARSAGGGIELEIIDPEPFSEAEDEAVQAGLAGIPIQGDTFYFGLVGTNAVDGREVIRFFDPSQEQFLEYEVARLIHTLAHPERKVVGVVSSLQLDGAPPNPLQPQPLQPWLIMTEMRSLFDVRVIPPGAPDRLDGTIDLLLVVHPQNLSDDMLYAIDQHVVAGGSAIVFVDPNCEAQPPPPGSQQNPMMAFEMDRSSNLAKLFTAWGVEYTADGIACDMDNALRVLMGGNRREQVTYVAWMDLGPNAVDPDDAVTGRLDSLRLATAGVLGHASGSTTTWQPLVHTSDQSMRMDASKFKFFPDPKALLTEFEPGGEELVVAARVSGPVQSAFPGGPPGEVEDASGHRAGSEQPANVLVVADVDMLSDRHWAEEMRLGQLRLGLRKVSDNGDFLINALDNMSGSGDLISIRARGQYARPFTRVEEIQREAERQYAAEEQALQEKLRDTERKLNELQGAETQGGRVILTPEQQAELDRFNQERLDTRVALRRVRHNLRKDIESLGTRLKIYNIILVPLAVALLAVVIGVYRVARSRAASR